jgi:peroxiredoxin
LALTKALDLSFDGASIFGGDRSKRYALVIEDGTVKEAHVEPDNTGLNGMFDVPFVETPLTRQQYLQQTRSCNQALKLP